MPDSFDEILHIGDDDNDPDMQPDAPVAVAEAPAEATPDAPAVEARTGGEPAPDGGTNTAATPAPLTREDGATWSEKAQRWYKDGKIVAGEPPESSTPPNAAPVAELPPSEAPKTPESSTSPAPAVEPFTFRANGQKHVIEGLTVAPEKQDLVRSLLVDGMNHRQNFPRMQAEWKQKVQQAEAMVAVKTEKYNRAAVHLYDKLQALLADNPAELEMTKRELALMLKEADLSVPQATRAEPEVDEQALEQGARATLNSYLAELLEDTPDAGKYLSDEDRKDLTQAFQSRLNAYFVEHEGEIVLDTHAAKADFDREIRIAQRAHQARETAARDAQKAKAAAAFNAAQKPVTPPPTPAKPRPQPATIAAPSGQRPGWDQSFKKAWDDTDDED